MLVSTLAASAIILVGGSVSPNVPAAQAASPTCTLSTYFSGSSGGVSFGVHTPTTSSKSTTCELGVGNASAAVSVVQNTAIRLYKQGIAKDGIYGGQTKAAVKYIQTRGGLAKKDQDGLYGPITRGVTWWPAQVPSGWYVKWTDATHLTFQKAKPSVLP